VALINAKKDNSGTLEMAAAKSAATAKILKGVE